ncbi:hypothetical protein HPB49_025581 [Dermacentor silvarum]|uniref:Uncharacterized protein n=1 Tax=Dermacentor silvarum TaxID=543639 RepID=A0ACB8DLS1_DERSI|nr:hypothetical protein HPB49_025581 [Dermacentor silvarum]
MPRCFVTGCTSGYDSQRSAEKRHFFRVPRDSSRLQVWQRAIPGLDKQLTSSCVVCDLHFEDRDLVKEFVHNINGDVVIIPRDNWALKDDAVPRLFPNCPSYLSKPARKCKQPAVRSAPPVKVRKRQGDGDVTSLCDGGSNSAVCRAIASLYSELVDFAKTKCIGDISSTEPVVGKDAYLTIYRSFKEGRLKHPSRKMLHFVKIVNHAVSHSLSGDQVTSDIFWGVLDELEMENIDRLGCVEHEAAFTCQVLNFIIVTRMHFYARDVNRRLENSEKAAVANKKARLL